LAQAQEEAKARASLSAIQQAQAEQMQQAGLAESMFGLGGRGAGLPQALQAAQLQNIVASQAAQFQPEQQLLSSLTPAINLASIADLGRRQGAGYLAEAGISGLETQAQTEIARANLLGGVYNALLGSPAAQQADGNTPNQLISGIFGGSGEDAATLGGLFSSIFGGGDN